MKILSIVAILLLLNCNFSDMDIEDDAFHEEIPIHIETWYFEAMSGNESIIFMITLAGKTIAMIGTQFYENGIVMHDERKVFISFYVSDEIPYISVDGKEIMKGYLKDGKLCYNISFSSKNISLKLLFQNRTNGWKSDTWIAIPNMVAKGSIIFNGKEYEIDGKGYHDHNIFYIWQPFLETGYIDGKIIAGNISLFWAKLMKKPLIQQNFAIYSNSTYHVLSVSIKCRDYKLNHGHFIPTSFFIDGEGINVTMHVYAVHFISLPFIKYWRFHIHSKGEVMGNKIETCDIAEYMLFSIF